MLLIFVRLARPFTSDDNPDDFNDADKLQVRCHRRPKNLFRASRV